MTWYAIRTVYCWDQIQALGYRMTLTRTISAFLLSPAVYILMYMTALAVFLQFTDLKDISGVEFYIPMYFLYVLLSIPIFFLVRRFHSWTFLSCSVSALLVVIVPEVMSFGSAAQEPVLRYQFWLSAAAAALAYGGVFWLLVPPDSRGRL